MSYYVDVEPVYANTTMKASYNDENVLRTYRIAPVEGYVMHTTSYDREVIDEETGTPTGEIILGFIPYPASTSVPYNYDFAANPKQIYAVPADTVPENQIYNAGGNNNHEIM